jgi:hypothetical protein
LELLEVSPGAARLQAMMLLLMTATFGLPSCFLGAIIIGTLFELTVMSGFVCQQPYCL